MKSIAGVWTALVTPFKNGEIDYISLRNLIRFQIDNGIQGFVVSGTTGESPTLQLSEKEEILKFVLSEVDGQVPVMFGSGSNSTAQTVELSKLAVLWGANSLLVVVPYYNKPPQAGLVQHFSTVANSVELPVVLYNVPGRTVTSLTLESIQELSKIKNIVGIKEATGDVSFGEKIVSTCGPSFSVLSGDDGTCIDLMSKGGDGVISVLSHVIPKQLVALSHEAKERNSGAVKDFKKFDSLTSLLFKESNPMPVKAALKLMGIITTEEVRLPLVGASEALKAELFQELKGQGLI